MKTTVIIFIFLFILLTSFAQPGSIDQSFGNDGILVDSSHDTYQVHTALQPDGKWIAAGNAITFDKNNQGNDDFLLVRYNPDGSIDTSFGNKGSVTTKFVPNAFDRCYAVSIQPDGKIVAAGTEFTYDVGYYHVAIARYNEDGTLDKAFGKEGLVDYSIAPQTTAYVKDMALQPDGKIVVAGNSYTTSNEPQTPFILRFAADGTVDTPFGNKGIVFLSSDNTERLQISSVLLQPDGKMLLGGTDPFTTLPAFFVLRYLPDGTPDKEFGTDGVAMRIFSEGTFSQLNSIALQRDGSIVCGGNKQILMGDRYQPTIALMRLTATGAFDDSFGSKGQATTIIKNGSEINHLLLQIDGKIIGAGTLNTGGEKPSFTVIRYLPDGSVDSSFGTDGLTVITMKTPLVCTNALLLENGKILQAGLGAVSSLERNIFVFARYNGDKEQQSLIARVKQFLHNHGISWQGLDNKNISYYSVQYSTTGKGFAEKGKLSGAGSSTLQQYNFTVADAGFYRIVAVDKRGYKTFSNKVMVSAGDLAASASVYPNPVKDYVSVQGLKTGEQSSISIANGSGTVLAKGTSNGSTQYRAPAANLQPGTYYLHITSGSKRETLKFVKE